MPQAPVFSKAFCYQRLPTIQSCFWWVWLQTPQAIRSFVYRSLIRLFGRRDIGRTYQLPLGIYIKFGLTPDEPLAMDFMRKYTTIPVPVVLDVLPTTVDFDLPDTSVLPFPDAPSPLRNPRGPDGKSISWMFVMTAIPGRLLFEHGKGSRLVNATEEQRLVIQNTLASWVRQLRDIQPPPDFRPQRVSGFLGGGFESYRLSEFLVGPYHDPTDFHSQDFCTVRKSRLEQSDERIQRVVAERPRKEYRIFLTHGDIVPHNILADEECRPTGLIDWETVGWMPEYWETAMSSRYDYWRMYLWKDMVREALPRYDDDLTLERLITLDYDF